MGHSDRAVRAVDLGDVLVVLDRPQSAENVGAVARVMKNFGLSRLAVVAPPSGPARPGAGGRGRRGRTCSGARGGSLARRATCSTRLAVHRDLRAALAGRDVGLRDDLAGGGGAAAARPGASSAARSPGVRAAGPVAIVFGEERRGLSDAELDLCQAVCAIPTARRVRLDEPGPGRGGRLATRWRRRQGRRSAAAARARRAGAPRDAGGALGPRQGAPRAGGLPEPAEPGAHPGGAAAASSRGPSRPSARRSCCVAAVRALERVVRERGRVGATADGRWAARRSTSGTRLRCAAGRGGGRGGRGGALVLLAALLPGVVVLLAEPVRDHLLLALGLAAGVVAARARLELAAAPLLVVEEAEPLRTVGALAALPRCRSSCRAPSPPAPSSSSSSSSSSRPWSALDSRALLAGQSLPLALPPSAARAWARACSGGGHLGEGDPDRLLGRLAAAHLHLDRAPDTLPWRRTSAAARGCGWRAPRTR